MKFDRTILLIIGVIIVLLLVVGIGYMSGAFGNTNSKATSTPTPSVTVTPMPTVQPTNGQTASPTATPMVTLTATPMATPWNNGMGFSTINWNMNPTAKPTPTPTPTPSPSATASPSASASASPSASALPSATASVTSTPTPTPTGSISVASTLDSVPTSSPAYSVSNGTGNNWGLSGLVYGSYTVTASLTGYDTHTQTVTVGSASVSVSFAFVTTTVNQVYDTAGIYTYTVPSGVTSINVTVIGGGGAGGNGEVMQGFGGGSGYVTNSTIAVSPGQTFMVIVGAGGSGTMPIYTYNANGPTSNIGGDGLDGGTSYFILETTGSPIDIKALGGQGGALGVYYAGPYGLGQNDGYAFWGGSGYPNSGYGTSGYGAGGDGSMHLFELAPSATDGAVLITNS